MNEPKNDTHHDICSLPKVPLLDAALQRGQVLPIFQSSLTRFPFGGNATPPHLPQRFIDFRSTYRPVRGGVFWVPRHPLLPTFPPQIAATIGRGRLLTFGTPCSVARAHRTAPERIATPGTGQHLVRHIIVVTDSLAHRLPSRRSVPLSAAAACCCVQVSQRCRW
jgi:hypothetical protein